MTKIGLQRTSIAKFNLLPLEEAIAGLDVCGQNIALGANRSGTAAPTAVSKVFKERASQAWATLPDTDQVIALHRQTAHRP